MKNILLTLAVLSLGTVAAAQRPVNALRAQQYVVAKAAVPTTPANPAVMPAPAVAMTPSTPSVPEALAMPVQDGLSKTISRTFPAGASDKISVSNQFGSITVRTWDRKEAKADVTISAYSSNAEEQRRLLEDTGIEAGKSGDQISFRTEMNTNRNGNWGSGTRNGKKWRREVRVNYVIYVPSTNPLTLSQQYGNVEIGSFAGPVNAKVQYGNFNAEKLSSSNNNLNVQYGKMTIQELNKATLKQQYGGGITLGSTRDINISAQYANVNIDRLVGDAIMSVQYNKVNIGQVVESSKVLTISAQYAGVDVGFSDGYKGRMDVRTSYGSFKFGNGVSAKVEGDDDNHGSFSKSYTGNVGGGGNSQVRVNSSYGAVTFR